MIQDDELDELDRLFAQLEQVEPPPDLLARVLVRAQASEAARWPRWRLALFGLGYAAALVLLFVFAFSTGAALERSQVRQLLSIAIHDLSAVKQAPDVYLAALRDAVPWSHVLVLALDLAVLVLATRFVLKAASPRERAAGPA